MDDLKALLYVVSSSLPPAVGSGPDLAQVHEPLDDLWPVTHHHIGKPLCLASRLYVALDPDVHCEIRALLVVHVAHSVREEVAVLKPLTHMPLAVMINVSILKLGVHKLGGEEPGNQGLP